MKILLCGGGSAGHVNPAIAIGEAITAKHKDTKLLYVGREGGFENGSVKKAGIELKTIKIEGLKRKISTENIRRIMLTFKATNEAKKIIKNFSPDAIIATGGYVSWPVIKAAQSLKIPTVLHESNVYPGLVTRLMARKCTLTLLNHEQTKNLLSSKAKTCVVGNPLRADFSRLSRKNARDEMGLKENDVLIISFGGSGGAEKLNQTLISIMKHSTSHTAGVHHIHATGKKYYEKINDANLKSADNPCKILPYIYDMPKKLMASDIVICRSGAMTLSELALVGACAILIPSPNVTDNHQFKNAKLLYDNNACIMIEEKDLTEELLRAKLERLIKDREARKGMAAKIKKFATKNAAENAAEKIINIIAKNNSAT